MYIFPLYEPYLVTIRNLSLELPSRDLIVYICHYHFFIIRWTFYLLLLIYICLFHLPYFHVAGKISVDPLSSSCLQ